MVSRKYHRPDHWQKVQFAPGQAFMPVVGVRPSDAQAFCSWLTQREQGLWQYRLPKRGEILSEEVQSLLGWEIPLGYWANEGQVMVWIPLSRLSEGTRQLAQVPTMAPLNLDLDHIHGFVSSIKLTKESNYHKLLVDYCISAEMLARETSPCAVFSVKDLAIALSNAGANILNSARTNDQTSSSYILFTQLLANLSICLCISNYNLWSHAQSYSSSRPFWRRSLVLRRREIPVLSKLQETLDRGVEICERLKRLDKRIKGEEHPCEGILIVKKRK